MVWFTFLLAALALIVGACTGATSATTPNSGEPQPLTWRDIPLRNAQTGELFTLADFAGRTVYVHPMARW